MLSCLGVHGLAAQASTSKTSLPFSSHGGLTLFGVRTCRSLTSYHNGQMKLSLVKIHVIYSHFLTEQGSEN